MKIGFLTPEYPVAEGSPSAGIGSSIRNISVALTRQGASVTVFVYGQQIDKIIVEDGVEIHLIRKIKYPLFSWYRYRKFLQNYINREISKNGIQIIEVPDYTGITAFMKLSVPVVVRFHGSDAYFCNLEKRQQKFKNFLLERFAVRNANAHSAPTDFAAKLTSKIFNVDIQKVLTIPNGISTDQFRNDEPEQFEQGLILYVGTLIRKKGVFELPGIMKEVVREYPAARLVLAGTDSYDLKSKSASTWELLKTNTEPSLLNRFEYVGKVPYAEILALIKRAHVCVFPTFAETQGMVTIEAMALQKPVVSSDFGWSRELIDDGIDGVLADPKNHRAFSGQILKLLSDDAFRMQISQNARVKATTKFDIKAIAAQTVAFYKSVLNT